MGLKVPAAKIDGTSSAAVGGCVSDSMVSVGAAGHGGTGSFISETGLIITNWHVAHEAVRLASIETKIDYLKLGYYFPPLVMLSVRTAILGQLRSLGHFGGGG
jgi:hypothetical protein